jgi:hypothetical protein
MFSKVAAVALLAFVSARCSAATELGIQGAQFTLNGKPTFLLGISYYGGLGASKETRRRDLDEIKRNGFNWIRVWATWAAFGEDVSAVTGDGLPRDEYLRRLRALVQECDRLGLVVDVTFSRGNGVTGPSRLGELEAHRRAVELLAKELKPFRNWYLDLSNERNIGDKRFTSFEDLKVLLAAVKQIDPNRLVTASQGGDIGRDELRRYLLDVKVDFITPHRPRGADSPKQTEAKTKEYLAWMKEMGRVAPVHYQEPFRRGYADWQPQAEDFLTDLDGAKAGGAAGWCFHNGSQRGVPDEEPRRSFDLRHKRLFEQLDTEERRLLSLISRRQTIVYYKLSL